MHFTKETISLFVAISCFSYVEAEKPPVLFYSSTINYNSLGYRGMIIDSSGAVRNYQLFIADSVFGMKKWDLSALLDRMLVKSTPTGKKVFTDTLHAMQTLIESASKGAVSFTNNNCMADEGIFRYSAVIYDSLNSNLKEIVCFQWGEQNACNSSPDAKAIARWLNSIDTVQGLTYSSYIRLYTPNDSSYLLRLTSCIPPDSCLYPSVAIFPVKPATATRVHSTPSAIVRLNGQIVKKPSRQLLVGQGGTMPLDLKPASPGWNEVR